MVVYLAVIALALLAACVICESAGMVLLVHWLPPMRRLISAVS